MEEQETEQQSSAGWRTRGGMVLGAQFTGVGRSDRELGPAICPLEAEEINIYSDHASDIGTQGKWKHYTI